MDVSLTLAYLALDESSPWRIVFDILPNYVIVVVQRTVWSRDSYQYTEGEVALWYVRGQSVTPTVIVTVIDFGGAQSIADAQKCFGTHKRYGELICTV